MPTSAKELVQDAVDTGKKVVRAAKETYRKIPTGEQLGQGLSSLRALRDFKVDESSGGLTAPSTAAPITRYDIMAGINSGIASAKGYYRGYIKPRIESTLADLRRKVTGE